MMSTDKMSTEKMSTDIMSTDKMPTKTDKMSIFFSSENQFSDFYFSSYRKNSMKIGVF